MMIQYRPAQQYLSDLKVAGGLSDAQIAKKIGLCRQSIFRLRVGIHKTTSHEAGIKIANLHAEVFKKKS